MTMTEQAQTDQGDPWIPQALRDRFGESSAQRGRGGKVDPEPAGSAGGESPEAASEGNAGGASGDQLVDKTTTAGAIEDLKRDLEAKISSTGAALDELEGTHEQDASRLTEVQHAIQEQAEVIGRLDYEP